MTIRSGVSADGQGIIALLETAGLPGSGLLTRDDTLVFVAESDHTVVGTAAVERYATHGLLRSVAVATPARGGGLGRSLVTEAIAAAAAAGLSDCWLITEDASDYFSGLGWLAVSLEDLPAEVRLSDEYTAHCSAAATAMVRSLG